MADYDINLGPDKNLENYFRRYANDRNSISKIENNILETAVTGELADDKYMDDYLRRYLNDNA